MRFWYCLGVLPDICPAHRPDVNGVVERFHRTLAEECLQVDHPTSLETTREAVTSFAQHYHYERPNQSVVCGNRPPAMAYPELPTRPCLPEEVDPDSWVQAITGKHYARSVKRDGCVEIDDHTYYVRKDFAGQRVTLHVEAATCSCLIWHRQQIIKRVPIKGLIGHTVSWEEYLRLIRAPNGRSISDANARNGSPNKRVNGGASQYDAPGNTTLGEGELCPKAGEPAQHLVSLNLRTFVEPITIQKEPSRTMGRVSPS